MKNWQERQFSRPQAARQGAAQGGACRMTKRQDSRFAQWSCPQGAAQGGAA
ncbi:hypothetical protein [Sedimenticola sp.]|uniref:hypothetical protein n=1 Tax=Sedimenticola sp. TaxID=1940285 RepID=UPI003D151E8B